jgi:hypothetical protein
VCQALIHVKIDMVLDFQKNLRCPCVVRVDGDDVGLYVQPCACSARVVPFEGRADAAGLVAFGRLLTRTLRAMRRGCTCGPRAPVLDVAGMGRDEPSPGGGAH